MVPIDLRSTPIDLLAFPGHKALYGPTGTGALYVGPRADGKLRPWREGGTGGDSSSETQPLVMPYLLEGGTPNVLGAAGLAEGIGWVIGTRARPTTGSRGWFAPAGRRLGPPGTEGWQIAGRWDPSTHVGALSLIVPDGLSPQDLGSILDVSFEIAVRPGLHCAPYIHRRQGTFPDGTLRLSPGPFTTCRSQIRRPIHRRRSAEITAGVL